MVGIIVARYFEPFRREMLEHSMLAHEILKNVIHQASFETIPTLKINANILLKLLFFD